MNVIFSAYMTCETTWLVARNLKSFRRHVKGSGICEAKRAYPSLCQTLPCSCAA